MINISNKINGIVISAKIKAITNCIALILSCFLILFYK